MHGPHESLKAGIYNSTIQVSMVPKDDKWNATWKEVPTKTEILFATRNTGCLADKVGL